MKVKMLFLFFVIYNLSFLINYKNINSNVFAAINNDSDCAAYPPAIPVRIGGILTDHDIPVKANAEGYNFEVRVGKNIEEKDGTVVQKPEVIAFTSKINSEGYFIIDIPMPNEGLPQDCKPLYNTDSCINLKVSQHEVPFSIKGSRIGYTTNNRDTCPTEVKKLESHFDLQFQLPESGDVVEFKPLDGNLILTDYVDFNGDKKIGLEDAIAILQVTAGIRSDYQSLLNQVTRIANTKENVMLGILYDNDAVNKIEPSSELNASTLNSDYSNANKIKRPRFIHVDFDNGG